MSITDERLKRVLHSAYYEVPYYNNVINSMISESDVDDDQTGELGELRIKSLFGRKLSSDSNTCAYGEDVRDFRTCNVYSVE